MPANTPTGQFFFDPDDRIYEQHFPGFPVVPGSLIIKAFYQALSQQGFQFERTVLQDFQFKRYVKPGTYDYYLQICANKIYCSLRSANREHVLGVFAYAR